MTYGTLIASVPVIQSLVSQPLPLRKAYELSRIAKKMNDELGFFRQKHEEIEKSGADDDEKQEKQNELLNFEVAWELGPLVLSPDYDVKLSAADLAVSEGLIEITEN